MHSKTIDVLAKCREALHALEFETHLRRQEFDTDQATARYAAKGAIRRVIAVMESEADPKPDDAESNATKRFLREQMSLCACATPRECPKCCLLEELLQALGYWAEQDRGAVTDPPAGPRLTLVAVDLASQEKNS